jgi:hypothetical protein
MESVTAAGQYRGLARGYAREKPLLISNRGAKIYHSSIVKLRENVVLANLAIRPHALPFTVRKIAGCSILAAPNRPVLDAQGTLHVQTGLFCVVLTSGPEFCPTRMFMCLGL